MLLLLTNTSLTALSSSLFSSRQISLSRMQQFINQLLDLQLFCANLSNTRRIAYRLFTKPSNSLTITWRQYIETDRHYNSLTFNCKMTLPYCATGSSARLRQSPTKIFPLKTPLLFPYWILKLTLTLTLTLTLLPLIPHFLVLVNLNFVVLPRWALWDHPERKQTIL